MANALYGKAREKYLMGDLDWLTDDVRAVAVDLADYTLSIDVDEFLSNIPAGARIGTTAALGTKTATLGTARAANTSFTAITGDPFEAIVLYRHTGVDTTADLIAYIDTAGGLPFTPNSGDANITWHANGIFTL